MSDETQHSDAKGSEEIIELIKERQAEEPEFNYRDYTVEDYIALGIFWILGLVVFFQFFTRYVLGFSYAWTEEGARYLNILVAFLGSVMAVRRNTHIFVEFFYRYLPKKVGRVLITIVDVIRIVFLAVGVKLGITIIPRTTNNYMSTVRIPLAAVYAIVTVGFLLMLFRAIQLAFRHWKEEYTPGSLEEKGEVPS
jgi:TRAP-type C4-dicarboxylate transport system permease small subunit